MGLERSHFFFLRRPGIEYVNDQYPSLRRVLKRAPQSPSWPVHARRPGSWVRGREARTGQTSQIRTRPLGLDIRRNQTTGGQLEISKHDTPRGSLRTVVLRSEVRLARTRRCRRQKLVGGSLKAGKCCQDSCTQEGKSCDQRPGYRLAKHHLNI